MNNSLSDEQLLLRDTVRRLAREKIARRAAERDEKGDFPWDSVEIFRENGLFGVDIPEKYGGSEMGLLSCCLMVEEIAKVCASSSVVLLVHELGSTPIVLAGSEEQKLKYLPSLASGDNLISFALTEPNCGSDVSGIQTKAELKNDRLLLNGRKIFISHGDVAKWICVACRLKQDTASPKGVGIVLVEQGYSGFHVGKKENKMGVRASSTVELVFEDCYAPVENRLGGDDQGFALIMKTFDYTRIPVAAQAVGIAQGAMDYALAYSKERRQFGKPVFSFQGMQFLFAEMATQIEAARQLTYKAAAIYDGFEKNLSRLPEEAIRYSAMCKLLASETAMKVTTDALQCLGGYGYTKEYPMERMMRDAKVTQIYEGTSQIQKMVIASTL